MKKTVLNTALIVALGFAMSACSGDKEGESHEVLAKDRVDAAAELAREKAPAAEDMAFAETAPMPAMPAADVDVTATDDATTDASESDTVMPEATATDSTDVAVTDSADMPATDAATDAEPATN